MNDLAKDWDVKTSTFDTLIGTDKHQIADHIPRGAMLQLIATKTGYSLDYLLAMSDQEFREQSRTTAQLEDDVATHIKRALDDAVSPVNAMGLDRGEAWHVRGDRVLRLAVAYALWQAGMIQGIDVDPYTYVYIATGPVTARIAELANDAAERPKRTQSKKRI